MSSTKRNQKRISNQRREERRRSIRITKISVVTTACILALSVTVVAAPMKQEAGPVSQKVSLPKAGISRVTSDYAQVADEADISVLAADLFEGKPASEFAYEGPAASDYAVADNTEDLDQLKESAAKLAGLGTSEAVSIPEVSEPEEIVYEEIYVEEPVYEEPVYEEPVYEESASDESVLTDFGNEEIVYEETEYVEPVEEYQEEEYTPEEEYVPEEEYTPEEEQYDEVEYAPEEENATEEEYAPEEEYVPEEEYTPEEEQQEVYEEEPADTAEDYETETEAPQEQTLEEFLEQQDEEIDRQAEEKEQQGTPSGEYLGQTIAYDACSYVGVTPYVWAGCSLETGTDCSGFTMLIYAKYGYELSHDSNVQSCQGRHVDISEALPGDIVVYPGHVAMYIGNGQIVHCPQPGEYVSIANMYYTYPLDIRRIVD